MALAFLAVVAGGIALRLLGYGAHFPFFLVKYGGSTLWGAMVYFMLAALLPRRPPGRLASVALVIAIVVELFRLVHTPWLDQFRLTLAGALLLGRIYSVWNMVAYAVGIGLALWIDRVCVERRARLGRADTK